MFPNAWKQNWVVLPSSWFPHTCQKFPASLGVHPSMMVWNHQPSSCCPPGFCNQDSPWPSVVPVTLAKRICLRVLDILDRPQASQHLSLVHRIHHIRWFQISETKKNKNSKRTNHIRNSGSIDQLVGFQSDWPSKFHGFILFKQIKKTNSRGNKNMNSMSDFRKTSAKSLLRTLGCSPRTGPLKSSDTARSQRWLFSQATSAPLWTSKSPCRPWNCQRSCRRSKKHGGKRQNIYRCCASNTVLKRISWFTWMPGKRLFKTKMHGEAPGY